MSGGLQRYLIESRHRQDDPSQSSCDTVENEMFGLLDLPVRSSLARKSFHLVELPFVIATFIPDISIAPLHVHYYSEVLLTTALILCRS